MTTGRERIKEIIKAEESLGRPLTEEEVTERVERFRETLSRISGFDPLTDEQKHAVLRLGLALKHNAEVEFLTESLFPRHLESLKTNTVVNLALETAEEIGIELTRKINDVAFVEAQKETNSLK